MLKKGKIEIDYFFKLGSLKYWKEKREKEVKKDKKGSKEKKIFLCFS